MNIRDLQGFRSRFLSLSRSGSTSAWIFVAGLLHTQSGHDSVWVVVDRLTKFAHFLPFKTTYSMDKLGNIFVVKIVRLHGAPVSIVSDRDSWFTYKFWTSLQKALGAKLNFSTTFHPQTDG